MSPEALIVIGVSSLVTLTCSTAADSSRTGRRLERASPNHCSNDHPLPEDDQDQPREMSLVGCRGPRTRA